MANKKVISVVGARPNFMKIAPIDRALKRFPNSIEHLIVHTGQHYDQKMSDSFFTELEMPNPAYFLGVGSDTHARQTAKIMVEFERVCIEAKPDLVLVAGDVNSTIAASLTSVKLGIPTAHIESGLRSFDRTMPEEINRIATDSISNYCFVTEESGRQNLLNENFHEENIFFVGNTMIDSLHYAMPKAKASPILNTLGLNPKDYVLVTLHRPSNVDSLEKITEFIEIFQTLSKHRKIVFPVHPRTLKNFKAFGLSERMDSIEGLILQEPLGYIDFLSLMMSADFVLTDSGGIQEETTALGVHCLTTRTTTERPVTCEIGTNLLVIPEKPYILTAIDDMLTKPCKAGKLPPLWDGKAAERIAQIIREKILS